MIGAKAKQKLLNEIYKFGNVFLSCSRIGISRAQYYRWKDEDEKFKEEADKAERLGRENISDVAEHKLLKNINDGNERAIEYALRFNSERYKPEKFNGAFSSTNQPQKTLEDLFDDYENNEQSNNITITREEFKRLKEMATLPKVNIEIVPPKERPPIQE